jgi:hypothetical protein
MQVWGDDVKIYSTIRIIAIPPGEAPIWVREEWVGLELPALGYSGPRRFFTFGLFSFPRSILAQCWGLLRGRANRISGYAVQSVAALDILATSSPEAAAWWRQNVPYVTDPRQGLVFLAHVCQEV